MNRSDIALQVHTRITAWPETYGKESFPDPGGGAADADIIGMSAKEWAEQGFAAGAGAHAVAVAARRRPELLRYGGGYLPDDELNIILTAEKVLELPGGRNKKDVDLWEWVLVGAPPREAMLAWLRRVADGETPADAYKKVKPGAK